MFKTKPVQAMGLDQNNGLVTWKLVTIWLELELVTGGHKNIKRNTES